MSNPSSENPTIRYTILLPLSAAPMTDTAPSAALAAYFSRHASTEDRTAFANAFTAVQTALESGSTLSGVPAVLPQDPTLCITEAQAAAGQAAPLVHNGSQLWLHRLWQSERQLAAALLARIRTPEFPFPADADTDSSLLPAQKEAVRHACRHALSLIIGGPGTGKTHTISRLAALLVRTQPDLRIALAAPTGKAAKRMEESLTAALAAAPELAAAILPRIPNAQTLHRLLGIGSTGLPKHHAENPINADLIIIDEASMLSLELARQLLDAVPMHARLILLGDANQLAAVEPGAVLHDISRHRAAQKAIVRLNESKRFHSGSAIGQLASLILNPPEDISAQLENLFSQHASLQHHPISAELYRQLDADYADYRTACEAYRHGGSLDAIYHAYSRTRILTASRHGALGTHAINQYLRRQHCLATGQNTDVAYYRGQPLLITANDYANNLYNGDIGHCLPDADGRLALHLPQRDAAIPLARLNPHYTDTAYAMTIHKSQGSEFDHAAIILDPARTEHLSRELLYTAITRAKSAVTLYASLSTLAAAACTPAQRSTGLAHFLDQQMLS